MGADRGISISAEGLTVQGFGRRETIALVHHLLPYTEIFRAGEVTQPIGFVSDSDTGAVNADAEPISGNGIAAKLFRR